MELLIGHRENAVNEIQQLLLIKPLGFIPDKKFL